MLSIIAQAQKFVNTCASKIGGVTFSRNVNNLCFKNKKCGAVKMKKWKNVEKTYVFSYNEVNNV